MSKLILAFCKGFAEAPKTENRFWMLNNLISHFKNLRIFSGPGKWSLYQVLLSSLSHYNKFWKSRTTHT